MIAYSRVDAYSKGLHVIKPTQFHDNPRQRHTLKYLQHTLMREGFMGGVHPPLYDTLFKTRKRFFASVIKIIWGIYG